MPDELMDPTLQTWLAQVDARWQASGLSPLARRRLRGELQRDIASAARAGADAAEFTSTDPDVFADDVALAYAAPTPRELDDWARVASTAILGALAGAAVTWFLLWPLMLTHLTLASDAAAGAVLYPAGAVAVLAGAIIALRIRLGARARYGSIVLPAVTAMCAGFAVGVPVSLMISRALAYPTDPALLLLEAIPILVCGAAGIWIARRVTPRVAAS